MTSDEVRDDFLTVNVDEWGDILIEFVLFAAKHFDMSETIDVWKNTNGVTLTAEQFTKVCEIIAAAEAISKGFISGRDKYDAEMQELIRTEDQP